MFLPPVIFPEGRLHPRRWGEEKPRIAFLKGLNFKSHLGESWRIPDISLGYEEVRKKLELETEVLQQTQWGPWDSSASSKLEDA